jgi:hypothetical protein
VKINDLRSTLPASLAGGKPAGRDRFIVPSTHSSRATTQGCPYPFQLFNFSTFQLFSHTHHSSLITHHSPLTTHCSALVIYSLTLTSLAPSVRHPALRACHSLTSVRQILLLPYFALAAQGSGNPPRYRHSKPITTKKKGSIHGILLPKEKFPVFL